MRPSRDRKKYGYEYSRRTFQSGVVSRSMGRGFDQCQPASGVREIDRSRRSHAVLLYATSSDPSFNDSPAIAESRCTSGVPNTDDHSTPPRLIAPTRTHPGICDDQRSSAIARSAEVGIIQG